MTITFAWVIRVSLDTRIFKSLSSNFSSINLQILSISFNDSHYVTQGSYFPSTIRHKHMQSVNSIICFNKDALMTSLWRESACHFCRQTAIVENRCFKYNVHGLIENMYVKLNIYLQIGNHLHDGIIFYCNHIFLCTDFRRKDTGKTVVYFIHDIMKNNL